MASEPIESVMERVAKLDRQATKRPWRVHESPGEYANGLHSIGRVHVLAPDMQPNARGVVISGNVCEPNSDRYRDDAALIASYRTDAVTLAEEVVRLQSVSNLAYEEKALADREFVAIDKQLAAERAKVADLAKELRHATAERDYLRGMMVPVPSDPDMPPVVTFTPKEAQTLRDTYPATAQVDFVDEQGLANHAPRTAYVHQSLLSGLRLDLVSERAKSKGLVALLREIKPRLMDIRYCDCGPGSGCPFGAVQGDIEAKIDAALAAGEA